MLRNNSKEEKPSYWWIPLTYTSASKLNFDQTKPTEWIKKEKSIELDSVSDDPNEWVIFNLYETGN
jgi:hypothetical protein